MIFLLAVFVVAVRLGRGPAILTAFLAVALFDVLFVPPQLSFTVADAQYLVTFAVMLAVGLITSHLAAQLSERTEQTQAKEQETRKLYLLAGDLGAALSLQQVAEIISSFLGISLGRFSLLVDQGQGKGSELVSYGNLTQESDGLAKATYQNAQPIESNGRMYLPLHGSTRVRGVLVFTSYETIPRPLLAAIASLASIAVERLHYAEVAQQSEIAAQSEKLRSSILSSISHDLRTPLTSLVGQADSLANIQAEAIDSIRARASVIRDQAHAMNRMVINLLELARLRSGSVRLNKQWQPVDEVIGSSVRLLEDILSTHPLKIDLPEDLPLVCFDSILIERVLVNLLENAAKYSAAGEAILISGTPIAGQLVISVCNTGSAFPSGQMDEVFELFTRGIQEDVTPGTGIGLAVCRDIILAHEGMIKAENTPEGACIRFSLPLGTPPQIQTESS